MKVILIDDNEIMLTVMKWQLRRMEGVEVVASFQNAEEAIAYFRTGGQVDLAFLEIKLAEADGLQLARDLRESNKELDIVFVTAHKEYALPAFDLYPLDYMIKPVSRLRLARTLEYARGKRGRCISNR